LAADALLALAAEFDPNIDENDGIEGIDGTDEQPASSGTSKPSNTVLRRGPLPDIPN
jgi:hypothetical protein